MAQRLFGRVALPIPLNCQGFQASCTFWWPSVVSDCSKGNRTTSCRELSGGVTFLMSFWDEQRGFPQVPVSIYEGYKGCEGCSQIASEPNGKVHADLAEDEVQSKLVNNMRIERVAPGISQRD